MMRAISSHPAIKMRVLILSAALFACATGAPSGALVAPLALVPAVSIPAPTVNPGDLQAAFIDAKVQTEDLLRAAADQTRDAAEQVVEETKEKVVEINDLAKERSLEAFWANEEKKWQALDAIKTAEARLDGEVAAQGEATAKSLVVPGVVAPIPAVAPVVAPIAPVVAPITPYYYPQSIIAPGFKTYSAESFIQLNPEAPKAEEKKEEAKSAEKPEEAKDAIEVKAADVKPEEKPEAPKENGKYVVANTPLIAQFPYQLKFAAPWVAPPVALVHPGLKTLPYTHIVPYPAPTVLKTVW